MYTLSIVAILANSNNSCNNEKIMNKNMNKNNSNFLIFVKNAIIKYILSGDQE